MMSYFQIFKQQLMRERKAYLRQLHKIINSCLFFLMVMIFFPLTMPPDANLLRVILPGLIWIAVLLAQLLSAERMFQQDNDDGVIEQWQVSGYPVSILVAAKITLHGAASLLPILFLCPLIALLFALNFHETQVLILSLLFGAPSIVCLCALSATFGIGLKSHEVLMALILLPLTIPVLIFGSSAATAVMQGLPASGYLAILLAMSLITILCIPFAIASILRE